MPRFSRFRLVALPLPMAAAPALTLAAKAKPRRESTIDRVYRELRESTEKGGR